MTQQGKFKRLAASIAAIIAKGLLVLIFVLAPFVVLADNGTWLNADIGISSEPGSATFTSPSQVTIAGTGSGIGGTGGGTSDGFYFVYQPVSKPILMQARLDSLTAGASHNANAGLMFRSTLEESSGFANISVVATTTIGVPGAGIQWRRRADINAGGSLPFPIRPEGLPIWLRSVFQDGLMTSFVSFDPKSEGWIELDSVRVEPGESGTLFAGFAVTSGEEARSVAASFSEISYQTLPECIRNLVAYHVEERVELSWTNAGSYDEITILKSTLGATNEVLETINGNLEGYTDRTIAVNLEAIYELIPSVAGYALCVARTATGKLAPSIGLVRTTIGTVIGPQPFPEELPVNPEAGGDTERKVGGQVQPILTPCFGIIFTFLLYNQFQSLKKIISHVLCFASVTVLTCLQPIHDEKNGSERLFCARSCDSPPLLRFYYYPTGGRSYIPIYDEQTLVKRISAHEFFHLRSNVIR